jgi:hypothetical protein
MAMIANIISRSFNLDGPDFDSSMPIGIKSRVLDNSNLLNSGFKFQSNIEDGLIDTCTCSAGNSTGVRR